MKRLFLALLLIVAVGRGYDTDTASQTHPNILVVMTDDLEMGTFQTMLAAGLLPNINARLVGQGITFDNSFVTDSLCCPSRATFLSGQYPHNDHVLSNYAAQGILNFDDSSTVATWAHDAGYFTGQVGKYLNAYASVPSAAPGTPTYPMYVPPGWDAWQGWVDYNGATYAAYDYIVNVNGTLVDQGQYGTAAWNYSTDLVSLRAAAFLSQWHTSHAAQPFFLWLTPVSPHFHMTNRSDLVIENVCPAPTDGLKAPLNNPGDLFGMVPEAPARYAGTLAGLFTLPQPPSFNEADVSDKPNWLSAQPAMNSTDIACAQAQYTRRMEALRAIDDQVGFVFQVLDAFGATNGTTVIFTSDNGYMKGEHRLTEKQWPYEESIRVPLVIHVAGQTTPRHVAAAVLNNDLAPTIAALAGATPTRTVDGMNITPYLTGTPTPARQQFLVEQWTGGVDPAPTSFTNGDLPVLPGPLFTIRVMTPTPEMYTEYSTGEREFYNLTLDPYELQNAAGDPANAAEITRLSSLLAALKSCAGTTCRRLEVLGTP